jgi:hypothetical protein
VRVVAARIGEWVAIPERAIRAVSMGPTPLLPVVCRKDDDDMKKLIVAVALLVGAGYLAKRFAPKLGDVDWEQHFAALPDNAPPKWMFRNISEIHEDTDRILELLDDRGQGATGSGEA